MMEIESRFVQATEAECKPFESTKNASNRRFVEQSRAAQAADPVGSRLQKLPSYILLNNLEELAQRESDGLRYASFRQNDGVSFVHIALIDTAGGNNPVAETAAFKAFQAEIKDRCEELPVAVALEEVGSYRCFGS